MSNRNRIIYILATLIIISVGAIIRAPCGALAQSGSLWAMNFGGSSDDCAYSIQQTADGGYIVAGLTESFGAGDEDFWVVKLTSNGQISWQKAYGGSLKDRAYSVQQTTDGGYIVAGSTDSFGAGSKDYWVVKITSNGSVEWQKTYGGVDPERARCIQQTTDGGYIVAGYTNSFGAGSSDIWILKLASNGNVQWQKTYGGSSSESTWSVQQTSDGGYIVAGWTESSGAGNSDYWVLKLSSEGNVQWQKSYGGVDDDDPYSVRQTADGGYIVVGVTESFGAGAEDFWVLKLASNGTVTWQKTYGGISDDASYSVHQTSDGGFVVLGMTESFGTGNGDFWLLKLTSNGNAEFQKTYGGINWDEPYSIGQISDGGYILAGSTESFGIGSEDFWVLRLNEEGTIPNLPECFYGIDSDITIKNTQSTVGDTTLAVGNTIASVSIPNYSLTDTDCSTYTQCYYSPTTPIVDEPNAEDGFASIAPFLETAYGYKLGEGTGGWTVYNPLWPSQMNSLKTLYVARGYWINVNQACSLQFGSNLYELDAGWNLIGWIPQL
ncbi:hypothetical protein ACFLWZ_02565 [Chloroflexota bacterium]